MTPRIHEGDSIRLEIDQQSSDLSTDASDVESGANTITTKRSIKTTILAEDREFIVLGGLVREDDTESVSKVPLLGDIPFIGVLFRSTQKSREKTNLMVFLKPTILREGGTLSSLSQNKYETIRELQLEINDSNGSISLYKDKDLPENIQDVWINEYDPERQAPSDLEKENQMDEANKKEEEDKNKKEEEDKNKKELVKDELIGEAPDKSAK